MKCQKCHSDNPDTKNFCSECGTRLTLQNEPSSSFTKTLETPTEELTRGSVFAGRYEVIEELGKGGMGRVYRVFDKKVDGEVALKLINSEISSDKKTVERFRNELKIARDITHKNVCRMYDLNEDHGTHYITMEYVPGGDLKRFIRRSKQLGISTALSIAKQICEGLEEAHNLGIVHRDLKPQNIMIDDDGNVRIMDFGIARTIRSKGITGPGMMIGTPEYMSPEQAEAKEIDLCSDIYSFGVILYEMVTGQLPFEGDTPLSIAMKHKGERPKDPRDLNTQAPEDLSQLILKCMEKDKERRYQSTNELLSELANIKKSIPTTEHTVLKRKLSTSREITVSFQPKKIFIPALVVVIISILAFIIWKPFSQKKAVPILSDKPSLAVIYFKNNTGDEGLEHWRTMLPNLLIADLTQSKYIRILSEDKLFNILSKLNQQEANTYSSDVLKQVATQGGVNNILQGAYAKAGDEFRINVTLQDTKTGELIGSESVAGKGEESIFNLVDELTRRIKAKFELSEEEITSDIDREVGKITTESPEALKYYIEGRKYHSVGDFRKSIQIMESAVSVDPEFALAYRSMASSYNNLSLYSEKKKYVQKALELTDRLSDLERYRIQGDFYKNSENTYDKAIEAYSNLLKLYPDDLTGNNNFGLFYSDLEDWDKAIERFEVPIKNKTESTIIYLNITSSYRAKGLYDKAQKILEEYIHNLKESDVIYRELALNYICQGKLDFAIAENDKAFYIDPNHYGNVLQKAQIYMFQDDFVKAEEEFQKLLKEKEPIALGSRLNYLSGLYSLQGRFEKSKSLLEQGVTLAERIGQKQWVVFFHRGLASMNLKTGNPEEALEESDKAWPAFVEEENTPRQRKLLHLKGLALLMMGSLDEAQKTADELRKMSENLINKKEMRRYYHLMGKIEQEKENFSSAVSNFEKASSLLPYQYDPWFGEQASFMDSLAFAYYTSGDLGKAREEYKRITSLTTGRIKDGDVYAKSFYMLGKIHEQQDSAARAIESYEKFLDLWKDADPGLPEVDDAKKRLSGLK